MATKVVLNEITRNGCIHTNGSIYSGHIYVQRNNCNLWEHLFGIVHRTNECFDFHQLLHTLYSTARSSLGTVASRGLLQQVSTRGNMLLLQVNTQTKHALWCCQRLFAPTSAEFESVLSIDRNIWLSILFLTFFVILLFIYLQIFASHAGMPSLRTEQISN